MSFHFDHWEIDDISPSKKKQKKLRVRYNNVCSIILIPCRQEYLDAGIDLWYSKRDQADAQYQLIEEVNEVLAVNPNLNLNLAMNYLYQPKYDVDNENIESSLLQINPSDKFNVNILIVNESILEYNKTMSSLVTSTLDSSWYLTFQHFTSIEDIVKLIETNKKLLDAKQVLTVIIIDQNVICNYDLWSISVFLPIPTLNNLREYFNNNLLIGLSLDHNSDAIKRKTIGNVVDFVWMKPINNDYNIDMLNILLKENLKKQYNEFLINSLKPIKSFDNYEDEIILNHSYNHISNTMITSTISSGTIDVSGSPLETYLKYLS